MSPSEPCIVAEKRHYGNAFCIYEKTQFQSSKGAA